MKMSIGLRGGLLVPLAVALVFVGCNLELLVPDGEGGSEQGLVVPITRLSLMELRGESRVPASAFITSLAADGVGETLQLEAVRFPAHNTMPEGEVYWRSLDPEAATVDQNGLVTVRLEGIRSTDRVFAEATIRAELRGNPTVFADMTVRIIPAWGNDRLLSFENWGNFTAAQGGLSTIQNRPGVAPVNDFGDLHLGDGIFLLLGTGGISQDEPIDRGAPTLGLEPNPDRHHSTSFVINPDNPFEFGIAANGSARALPTGTSVVLDQGAVVNFNDPLAAAPVNVTGNLRLAGDGGRQFMILGLQAPFEIFVRYMANGAGDRWVDIRFGDTSGVRIEGPLSTSATAPAQARTVRFRYEDFLHSFDADGEPEWVLRDGSRVPQAAFAAPGDGQDDPRVRLDPMVPATFVEFIGGMRIYEIKVVDLSGSAP